MATQPPAAIVGCILDVSASMRERLGSGRLDNNASDRLSAIVRAALKLAKAEQQHDGNAYMFVGVFGLDEKGGHPPVVDLCSVIAALELGDAHGGHEALVDLANANDVAHINRYIRTKLTATEARIVYAHLHRHPESIREFMRQITGKEVDPSSAAPARATRNKTNNVLTRSPHTAPSLMPNLMHIYAPSVHGAYVYCKESVKDNLVEYTGAMRLARRICREWLSDFTELTPLRVGEVVCLLENLQEQTRADELKSKDDLPGRTLIDTIRDYMYGTTPMAKALDTCLLTFAKHADVPQKVLLVVSDGESTDGDPTPKAQKLKADNVHLATVYITDKTRLCSRQLFDRGCSDWTEGQRTLFAMASKVSASKHPVPVLTSLGWAIPSSGECALYANVSSISVLDELCSMLFRARFGSTDVLFDVIGRVRLDAYVNDSHVRTCNNPSDQGQSSTCYAHAIAAIIHMALLRIQGREGGHPEIPEIRDQILRNFPPGGHGQVSKKVLEAATAWYRPLRFNEVDEEGARQAVLKRRPVLATFRLSNSGWKVFSEHFKPENGRSTILKREQMEQYRSETQAGGHAVVLTGCDPTSLTFLNSWGHQWGDNGSFSIENAGVLSLDVYPVRFYDVHWLLSDLVDGERQAYSSANTEAFQTRASRYPSIFEIDAQCPSCKQSALIADFTGDIREAVCPKCHKGFAPEPSHLLQALYARNGLGGETRGSGDR